MITTGLFLPNHTSNGKSSSEFSRLNSRGNLISGALARTAVGFLLNPFTVCKARFEVSDFDFNDAIMIDWHIPIRAICTNINLSLEHSLTLSNNLVHVVSYLVSLLRLYVTLLMLVYMLLFTKAWRITDVGSYHVALDVKTDLYSSIQRKWE